MYLHITKNKSKQVNTNLLYNNEELITSFELMETDNVTNFIKDIIIQSDYTVYIDGNRVPVKSNEIPLKKDILRTTI